MTPSTFPEDILRALNNTSPGDPQTVEPSPEVVEARAKQLTVEDVERLRLEAEAELAPEDRPVERRPMDPIEAWERGLA